MKPLIGLIIYTLLLTLSGCGGGTDTPTPEPQSAQPDSPAQDAPLVIIAMGNSLTEGLGVDLDDAYPAQLKRKLQADGYNVSVINAGVSGETSSGALSRVDWVLTLQPDIVILETGPNDGLRGIDPALTEQNLDDLVKTFQENDVAVVLAGLQIVQNMGEAYTAQFRAIYPRVAEQYGVIRIPFFLEGVGGNPALNQADSIHPTVEGYAVVVETVYPYVVVAINQLHEQE